jgi:hypothetical protein
MTRPGDCTREAPLDRGPRCGLRPRTWIAFAWIAGAPLIACGAPPGVETTAASAAPIYGGVEDNDAHQNPAVVALEVGNNGTTFTLCSGALVAPNVVLTARHCVSVQNSAAVTCDQNGVSATAPDFGADQAASSILVFTGATPALRGSAAATGKAIFHAAGNTLCNLDLALVVLDAPIAGITPLSVRLAGAVTSNESVRAVGYGENDQNAPLGTRFRKDGVTVLAVGSTISASMTPLGSNEFEVGESMCGGDSGGPAIDETTGAIVGVVSRGGACTDTFGHVYTSLAGLAPVFQQAFAAAGTAPVEEGQSWPAADAGGVPTQGQPDPAEGGASPAPTGTAPVEPPSEDAPINLRAGQGQSCAVSQSPGNAAIDAFSGAAALTIAFAFVRRRRPLR